MSLNSGECVTNYSNQQIHHDDHFNNCCCEEAEPSEIIEFCCVEISHCHMVTKSYWIHWGVGHGDVIVGWKRKESECEATQDYQEDEAEISYVHQDATDWID